MDSYKMCWHTVAKGMDRRMELKETTLNTLRCD